MAFHDSCFRQVTPPTGSDYYYNSQSAGSNRNSIISYHDYDTSPRSIDTQATTPPHSPYMSTGPVLLPKIRSQDQQMDSVAAPAVHLHHHRPSSSVTSAGFALGFNEHRMPPQFSRRSMSPPDFNFSTSQSDICGIRSTRSSPAPSVHLQRPQMPHSRAASTSALNSHSRSTSVSNLDDVAIRKYICPTYRSMPTYTTTTINIPNPSAQSLLHGLAPSFGPRPQEQQQPQSLPAELLFDSYPEPPASTTLMDYLTAPNPSPALCRRTTPPNRLQDTHFWWDIRNVLPWSDFNLDTIQNIPGLSQLLDFPIPEPALPTPPRVNTHPESEAALHDIHASHFATKVNAALKVALGTNSHLAIRANRPQTAAPASRQQPDFIANYPNDYMHEHTLTGDSRGRVVGLVKSFSSWNSGQRAEPSANAKIAYQRELAALHRHMREHSCRYGFILTEIELVCVRAGTANVPSYGLLELAPPVQLATHGRAGGQMTAGLALWYLHMLAKNSPLQGQCGWKMDVGGPAALTRQNCQPRDKWMLKPEGKEKRDAKRVRGWVFPEEPLSRKECGGRRKWSKSV